MSLTLADVLEHLVKQTSWFTEADRDEAIQVVRKVGYTWPGQVILETVQTTNPGVSPVGPHDSSTGPSTTSPTAATAASPSPATPFAPVTPTPAASTTSDSPSSGFSDPTDGVASSEGSSPFVQFTGYPSVSATADGPDAAPMESDAPAVASVDGGGSSAEEPGDEPTAATVTETHGGIATHRAASDTPLS